MHFEMFNRLHLHGKKNVLMVIRVVPVITKDEIILTLDVLICSQDVFNMVLPPKFHSMNMELYLLLHS